MGMTVQQGHTTTVSQQRPSIQPQIPPLKMKIAGIPVYQLDASEIQALLSQATETAGGGTHGSAQ